MDGRASLTMQFRRRKGKKAFFWLLLLCFEKIKTSNRYACAVLYNVS